MRARASSSLATAPSQSTPFSPKRPLKTSKGGIVGIIKPPIPAEGAGRPPSNVRRCKALVGVLFLHPRSSNHKLNGAGFPQGVRYRLSFKSAQGNGLRKLHVN